MNLARYFSGSLKALGPKQSPDQNWSNFFDLSENGFRQSFLTIPISLPFFYICAAAIHKQRLEILQQNPDFEGQLPGLIPPIFFVLVFLFYGISFFAVAYFLGKAFQKDDSLKSWVIVRHWTFFFLALMAGAVFGLSYMGLVSFAAILPIAFILYLGTLAVDIRLAQKIAGFEWGAAILAGCMITALGLMVVLIGVTRLGG